MNKGCHVVEPFDAYRLPSQLTDNPQYLSGSHLAIFDPHRWAFEHGGWRESLQKVVSQYPDQLSPFSSFHEGEWDGGFPGTVVRLALRPASSRSKISAKSPSVDEIHVLIEKFINEELALVLLFLTNLRTVEVREIDEEGHMQVLATATKVLCPRIQPAPPRFPIDLNTITVEYHNPPRTMSSGWRVIRTTFTAEECVNTLASALEDTVEYVKDEMAREKLRPDIALAFPTLPTPSLRGRLFTFLPLPLITSFPCHLQGVFSLTDSRQNLRNPSETIMSRTADQYVFRCTPFACPNIRLSGLLLNGTSSYSLH